MSNDPVMVDSVEIRVKYADGSSIELFGGAARSANIDTERDYRYANSRVFTGNGITSYTLTVDNPLMDENQVYFTLHKHKPEEGND